MFTLKILGYHIGSAAVLHGDTVLVQQISCSGNEMDISQCQISFHTPLSSCNARTVASLECQGKQSMLLLQILQ